MPLPTVTIVPLDTLAPDPANANLHTARGEGLLRDSIQADGLIDGGTLAANDDMISGSSRLEQAQAVGLAEAIIVESDGTRPVYIRRTDIPTGDHPRARRLGVAANRIAQTNLAWDADRLVALREEGLLGGLWSDDELAALAEPGAGDADWMAAFETPGATADLETVNITFVVPKVDEALIREALGRYAKDKNQALVGMARACLT